MSPQTLIDGLPQRRHLNDFHIRKYCDHLQRLGQDEKFHLVRAGGVGGSESAAILAHYNSIYTAERIDDSFKTAEEISLEKLLMVPPRPDTIYTIRGKGIEAFTAACFEARHGLSDKVDHVLEEACRKHKTAPMLGNIDRGYSVNGKRIIIDFKSSATEYTTVPFTFIAQLNHYDATGTSNGVSSDELGIACISAPEQLFPDLIKAYDERHENPAPYNFWLDQIANGKSSCVKLTYHRVEKSPDLQRALEGAATRFFNEYPMQGKSIDNGQRTKVLNEVELVTAARLEYSLFNLLQMEKSVAHEIQEAKNQVNAFTKSLGGGFVWPEVAPAKISTSRPLNINLALQALELKGVEKGKLFKRTNKLDHERTMEVLQSHGEHKNLAVFQSELDINAVESELQRQGIDRNMLLTSDFSVSAQVSKKNIFKDQVSANQFDVAELVDQCLALKARNDTANTAPVNEDQFNIMRHEL